MDRRRVEFKPSAATERRISWLTLLFGLGAGLLVGLLRDPLWGAGLAIGGVLAWLNFRWLRQGLDALVAASRAQAAAARPRVPVGTYFRALFRYALIALLVYVIFKVLRVPLAGMVVGLCALAAATIAASVYEVWRPTE
ncbi:MAG TPA: ATP synthase subunit I [Candidatus Dormibacteraeota bacterium]|nr:ATP synthase subunit I [Candidatus Dormibacteraeota bacterium]